MTDAEQLAVAMAEEFAASLPTDEAGWLEAAQRIADRVERAPPLDSARPRV